MSQVLQTEPPVAHRAFAVKPAWSGVWQIVTLGVLLLWLYAPTLTHLLGQWWHDPNFSHGFFVPLFAGFVIWQERDRLARVKLQPAWSGALILGLGLCVLILGQWAPRFSLPEKKVYRVSDPGIKSPRLERGSSSELKEMVDELSFNSVRKYLLNFFNNDLAPTPLI